MQIRQKDSIWHLFAFIKIMTQNVAKSEIFEELHKKILE